MTGSGSFAPAPTSESLEHVSSERVTYPSTEKDRRRSLIRGVMGVSFEYYDFVVYAIFAPYFSKLFFPQESALAASLNTLAIFALGFLARPIGAMLAGRLADRTVELARDVLHHGFGGTGVARSLAAVGEQRLRPCAE